MIMQNTESATCFPICADMLDQSDCSSQSVLLEELSAVPAECGNPTTCGIVNTPSSSPPDVVGDDLMLDDTSCPVSNTSQFSCHSYPTRPTLLSISRDADERALLNVTKDLSPDSFHNTPHILETVRNTDESFDAMLDLPHSGTCQISENCHEVMDGMLHEDEGGEWQPGHHETGAGSRQCGYKDGTDMLF